MKLSWYSWGTSAVVRKSRRFSHCTKKGFGGLKSLFGAVRTWLCSNPDRADVPLLWDDLSNCPLHLVLLQAVAVLPHCSWANDQVISFRALRTCWRVSVVPDQEISWIWLQSIHRQDQHLIYRATALLSVDIFFFTQWQKFLGLFR